MWKPVYMYIVVMFQHFKDKLHVLFSLGQKCGNKISFYDGGSIHGMSIIFKRQSWTELSWFNLSRFILRTLARFVELCEEFRMCRSRSK